MMAKPQSDRVVQQSLLDRLCKQEVGSTSTAASVRAFKRGVRRDLEWLLNTRRIADLAPEVFTEVCSSLYHYGIPDISSMSSDSGDVRRRLLRAIEETITLYEPRLVGARASIAESEDGSRELHFVIEGLLRMDPEPEQVAFDTVLELSSGQFQVSGDGHA